MTVHIYSKKNFFAILHRFCWDSAEQKNEKLLSTLKKYIANPDS